MPKNNYNSYHDGTSTFFQCFFPKKTDTLMPLNVCLIVLDNLCEISGHSIITGFISPMFGFSKVFG